MKYLRPSMGSALMSSPHAPTSLENLVRIGCSQSFNTLPSCRQPHGMLQVPSTFKQRVFTYDKYWNKDSGNVSHSILHPAPQHQHQHHHH